MIYALTEVMALLKKLKVLPLCMWILGTDINTLDQFSSWASLWCEAHAMMLFLITV